LAARRRTINWIDRQNRHSFSAKRGRWRFLLKMMASNWHGRETGKSDKFAKTLKVCAVGGR
jgi:hypothetical protein